MTSATAILVPVLNRPQNVAPLIASIEAATPEPHRILFLASEGDDAEQTAIEAEPDPDANVWMQVVNEPGTWARKINSGFRETAEPFVFLAADDLRFHDGWLAEALNVMESYGTVVTAPDGSRTYEESVAVVGTNDLGNPRTFDHANPGYPHATHSLVRRSYIDEQGGTMDKGPGVVLCEEYPHDYADDEFVETAKARGVYAHADLSHVEHLHPNYAKADDDDTYALGRSRSRDGQRIFNRRAAALGFAGQRGFRSSRDAGELGRRAADG